MKPSTSKKYGYKPVVSTVPKEGEVEAWVHQQGEPDSPKSKKDTGKAEQIKEPEVKQDAVNPSRSKLKYVRAMNPCHSRSDSPPAAPRGNHNAQEARSRARVVYTKPQLKDDTDEVDPSLSGHDDDRDSDEDYVFEQEEEDDQY